MFFGGKGGVGKSTIASAVALGLAEDGYSVQLVSTDPAHNLGHMCEQAVGARGVTAQASANLHLLELDPAATTKAHIAQVEDTMRRMMPERLHGEVAKHLDLARNSPGTHEAAMVEAIAQVVEDSDHDFLIFDTAPSGHTARLLAVPELMNAWTQGLMNRREKSERFSELIRGMDPKTLPPTQWTAATRSCAPSCTNASKGLPVCGMLCSNNQCFIWYSQQRRCRFWKPRNCMQSWRKLGFALVARW